MGFFDIFDFSWKKDFEDLLSSNKDAVECFVHKKYVVYEDMRPDDKSLIKDYLQTYENDFLPLTTYIEPLDHLSKEAKKFLTQRKSEILLLYQCYAKYSTPHKRVLSLYERFSKGNFFDRAFRDYLGDNYDINNLSEEQIHFILENQLLPSLYAAEDREKRDKKIKEQRERLRERYVDREISILLKRQKSLLPEEIHLPNNRCKLTAKLQFMVYDLEDKFRQNGIFQRVCSFYYAGFETVESLTDSQRIFILAHQEDFEMEKHFFELAKEESIEENAYISFLKHKKLLNNHEGIVYCLEHFDEIPPFISASVQDAKYTEWINAQKVLNDKGKQLAAHYLPQFRCRYLRTYINHIGVDGKQVRKVLPFNLFSQFDYTNEIPTSEDLKQPYAFVYYNKTKAQNALNITINQETTIMANLAFLAFNIKNQMVTGGVVVALGTSGMDDPVLFNQIKFWKLKRKLDGQGILCVNVNELTKVNVKKNIVVVEMVSKIERLRNTCMAISKRFPGTNIAYVSFYNELTKNQLNTLKEMNHSSCPSS